MSPSRKWRVIALVSILLFLLLLTVACSEPTGLRASEPAIQNDGAQVPFQNGEPPSPTNVAATMVDDHGQLIAKGLPFRDGQSLPVGTLLTVRLKTPVSTDAPEASDTFEGIVEDAVIIDGNIVIPRGARAAGRVESAGTARFKRSRNYVRLTLDSVALAGKDLPVQTSSLFAHGKAAATVTNPDGLGGAGIYLEKGRRLTFRLTEPVYVASQQPPSVR